MVSKFFDKLKKKKEDNQGAAIVIVIVAIAFIGMLIAMLVYMTYYNYLMKHIDRSAKDNFYSAEYALEIINAGLQKDISDSMSEAYVKAMKNSADLDSQAITINFQNYFITNLQNRLCVHGATPDTTKWDVDHLKDMWKVDDGTGTLKDGADGFGFKVAASAGQEGAYLEAKGGINSLTVTSTKHISIDNVKIVYTNKAGYVSIIETDIRLKVPDLDFAQTATKLNLEEFSLVANNSLINDSHDSHDVPPGFAESGISINKGSANTSISGSVYAGKEGLVVANSGGMKFVEDLNDKADAIANGTTYTYRFIADSINVENATGNNSGIIEMDKTFDSYVSNVNITSANFNSAANMYVEDDMDISGKRSKVTLSGTYKGYGSDGEDSQESSAILINGAETTLDFSKLKELVLSGHAYVGARRYDADEHRYAIGTLLKAGETHSRTEIANALLNVGDGDKIEDIDNYNAILESDAYDILLEAEQNNGYTEVPKNTSDIMMGESMAVKANQLFYMVPAECIGYRRSDDVQTIAKNPMTFDEYSKLTTTIDTDSQAYKDFVNSFKTAYNREPDLTNPNDFKLVPKDAYKYEPVRLSVLWNNMGTESFTDNYKAVYRRINGNVMVYLFLDFGGSESDANKFFRAYYEYDKDAVDLYVNSYIRDMKWNSALRGNNLTLAGNSFYINGSDDSVVLVEDSLSDTNKILKMSDWQEQYSKTYFSLMHTLKPDAVSGGAAAEDVFTYLVDSDALNNISAISTRKFEDTTSGIYAYVGKGNVVYPSSTCPAGTAVIITSGDVYLNGNYDGLVLAGGNIYICSNCTSVTYNPAKVLKALRLSYTDPVLNTTTYVYDVFGINGQISYGVVAPSAENSTIQLRDLITYQNWKKE